MIEGFLVEMSDGSFVFKALSELRPEDRVVFDGPGAFSELDTAKESLDAEIAAAGGLEAWRAAGIGH